MPGARAPDLRRARVEAVLGTSVDGDAGIARAQFVDRQGDGRVTELGEHDLAGAGGGIAGQQHAGLLTLQQQHRRQQGRLDVVKRLADDAAGQPGAVRGALEQRRREPPALERQAGEHPVRGDRLPMRLRHREQAAQQGVGAALTGWLG